MKSSDYYNGKDLVETMRPRKPTPPRGDNPILFRDYADKLEVYQKQLEEYRESATKIQRTKNARFEEFVEEVFKLMVEYNPNSKIENAKRLVYYMNETLETKDTDLIYEEINEIMELTNG